MARQTKERAEQTREAILDAAEQVFHQRGVARASLEEVGRTAGVTRGAVYWHFKDKLDLFLAIEERVQLPQAQMLAELSRSSSRDALSALENAIVSAFRQYDTGDRKRIQLTVLLLRCDYVDEMAPALERQAVLRGNFFTEVRRFFRDVVGPTGMVSGWQPEMAAQVVHTLVDGAILHWLRSPAEFPLKTSGVAVMQSFIASLRKA